MSAAHDTQAQDLHGAIMNLKCTPPADANINQRLSYKSGHRDARHAAAELALTALASRLQEQEGQPSTFPARILTVLHELADRKGTPTRGPAEDANGEPLQDDADAALAWLAARQEERPVLSEKEAFMRTLGWHPPATLAAGSQAVHVPGWRPTDDEIRQAWDDLQKREEAALQALRAARIGSTCAACGVGKLAADGNGYNNFERCDSCRHVPFYDENGVDMIAKLAKARAAAPLQPLAGGESQV